MSAQFNSIYVAFRFDNVGLTYQQAQSQFDEMVDTYPMAVLSAPSTIKRLYIDKFSHKMYLGIETQQTNWAFIDGKWIDDQFHFIPRHLNFHNRKNKFDQYISEYFSNMEKPL